MISNRYNSLFASLTDAELIALHIRIRSGRDRAWRATGPDADARYLVVTDASEILTDIHVENAQR